MAQTPDDRASADAAAPPADATGTAQALWWLAHGGHAVGPDWERAHEIAQAHEGDPVHDWIHALIHRIEGDTANAAYWYRRAGRSPATGAFADEARGIAAFAEGRGG